jgi:hypothetical protein
LKDQEIAGKRERPEDIVMKLWQVEVLQVQGLPHGTGDWELFDLASDPGETPDLASERSDICDMLARHLEEYAAANSVILPDTSPVSRRRSDAVGSGGRNRRRPAPKLTGGGGVSDQVVDLDSAVFHR